MSAGDEADLTRCYDMLLRARVALHLATERAGDVLRLEEQDATAVQGGWTERRQPDGIGRGGGPNRRLAVRGELGTGRPSPGRSPPIGRSLPVWSSSTVRSNWSPAPIRRPIRRSSCKAAVAAARNDVRIGRATLDLLHREIEGWPGNWPVGATDELVALLLEGHRAIPVLEALDQRELFSRLLPEWEPVRSKPQRNAYHRFTVDRHLWEAAANAAESGRPGGPPRPARDGRAAARHRQGIPGRSHRGRHGHRAPTRTAARLLGRRGRHAGGDGGASPAAARRRDAPRSHRRRDDRTGRRGRSARSSDSSCSMR